MHTPLPEGHPYGPMTWFETFDAYRCWRRMSDWTTNLYEQDDRDAEAQRLLEAERQSQGSMTSSAAAATGETGQQQTTLPGATGDGAMIPPEQQSPEVYDIGDAPFATCAHQDCGELIQTLEEARRCRFCYRWYHDLCLTGHATAPGTGRGVCSSCC